MAKTYYDIYMETRKRFKQAGVNEYSLEARTLLAHIAHKTTTEFLRDIRLYTSKKYEEKAEYTIERRLKGEPLAYITGNWDFYGLPLVITKDVLVPRTDSEVIAEAGIGLIRQKRVCRVLDLCCGSGCIGLAIAANVPNSRLVLADNSNAALKVAKTNSIKNRLASRTSCIICDALDSPTGMLGTFDLIVCNPPYIRTEEIKTLDPSVRDFEPHAALDGGEDGLKFYRNICTEWTKLLNEDGYLIFECGIGQYSDVKAIGEEACLRHIKTIKDTLEIDRAVVFQKI